MAKEGELVAIRHPAPVRFVPARGRNERLAMLAITTPAVVPRTRESDFEPVPALTGRVDMVRSEGALWSIVHRGPGREIPLPPRDFLSMLSGRLPPCPAFDLCARGTPLLAWGDPDAPGAPYSTSPVWRGDDLAADLDRARKVTLDRRSLSAAALSAHMASDYRITDAHVYRRRRPLAVCETGRPSRVDLNASDSGVLSYNGDQILAGPSTYAAAMRLAVEHNRLSQDGPAVERWLGAGVAEALAGDEHRAMANSWPGWLRRRADIVLRGGTAPEWEERLGTLRPTLLAMEVDAMTGTAGAVDVGSALRTLRDALQAFHRCGPMQGRGRGETALRAIEEVYLPSLPEAMVSDEDAEALGVLVP
jgi:hypothetical protein